VICAYTAKDQKLVVINIGIGQPVSAGEVKNEAALSLFLAALGEAGRDMVKAV
jgi:hypothetical protein